MKKVNLTRLILSFLCLAATCSVISMLSVNKEYAWTPVVMNPWNGVEGIAFTIGRFLQTDALIVNTITAVLLAFIWWRLYALLGQIPFLRKENRDE